MKKARIWAIAMAAFMTVGFVGCGDKDKDIEYTGNTLKNGESIEINDFGNDATASYKLHFTLTLKNGFLYTKGLESEPTEEAIKAGITTEKGKTSALIADCGEVKGLSKIEEYPTAGYVDSIAAVEKHGYVMKFKGSANWDMYQNDKIHDPAEQYLRIWLEEQTDEGFNLRYEWPWVKTEE